MCQILGMNCAEKTDFSFSFKGFRLRGGLTGKHEDGFGIAFYEGRGLRSFVDTLPAATSPLAEMISEYPIKTLTMVSHIRYATQGKAGSLANVHPFSREIWGMHFIFVHNGDVPKFSAKPQNNMNENEDGLHLHQHQNLHHQMHQFPLLGKTTVEDIIYTPVGDTDSEAVFCAILNALKAEFKSPPPLSTFYQTLRELCNEIVSGEEDKSILNFLMGCGQYTLFAFSWPGSRPGSTVWNGLHYTVRQPPFTSAELVDMDCKVDFSTVTTERDRVAVIATAPLTKNETWIEFEKGELLMFDKGQPYSSADTRHCETIEKEGRGLTKMKSRATLDMLGKDSILIPNCVQLNKNFLGQDHVNINTFVEEIAL